MAKVRVSQINRIVSKRVDTLAKQHNLSNIEVAALIDTDANYYARTKCGWRPLTLQQLDKLASFFNTPVFSFFMDNEKDDRFLIETARHMIMSRPPRERDFLIKMVEDNILLLYKRPRET